MRYSAVANSVRTATSEAERVVRPFEGLRLKPYICSAGVPTIGFGATYYLDGKRVTLNDPPITTEKAEQLLRYHLAKYELGVKKLLPGVALTPYELGAAISFCFNLGLGAFRSSTLRKRILSGDFDDVPNQLSRWVYAGGKKSRGLARRRKAEGLLWQDLL